MTKIIKHWCLYYVWTIRFFEKKRIKGAQEIAGNLVIVPIGIYIMLYIIAPLIVFSVNNSTFLKNYKWIIAFIATLIISYITGIILKNKTVKKNLDIYLSIEDWQNSIYNKKGKQIFYFHFIFSILSVPITFFLFGYLL